MSEKSRRLTDQVFVVVVAAGIRSVQVNDQRILLARTGAVTRGQRQPEGNARGTRDPGIGEMSLFPKQRLTVPHFTKILQRGKPNGHGHRLIHLRRCAHGIELQPSAIARRNDVRIRRQRGNDARQHQTWECKGYSNPPCRKYRKSIHNEDLVPDGQNNDVN